MWWVALGVCALACGVVLGWARRQRRHFAETRRRLLDTYAAETSPYPFISDEKWRGWRGYAGDDLGMGARTLEMNLVTVSEDQKARIASRPMSGPSPVPGTIDECALQLRELKSDVFLMGPGNWPVCCDRLATLMGSDELGKAEAQLGPLDACAVGEGSDSWPNECRSWRAKNADQPKDGVAFFQCRGCGRPYVAFHEP